MESRPRNLFNPKHLHPSKHPRIHPGTTNRLLRNAVQKATLRCQHSSYESSPMHLAWRPGQRPQVHLAWLQEVAYIKPHSRIYRDGRTPWPTLVSHPLSKPPKILHNYHYLIQQPSFNRRVPSISKPQKSLKVSHN
ncbi:hypothetical protein MRX96_018757 [Rhipicephalus microplus]